MTIKRTTLALGAALLVGLAGQAFAQESGSQAGGDAMSRSGESKDAMFMRHAAADGMAEIEMSRIALDKSSSAQVKQLAQRIIDDHSRANDQLMAIAQTKQVTLPTEPMPMHKQEAERLRAMSGTSFDQAFAQAMVKDHRKAIKMFGKESENATDSSLKQFASATLPALKEHLQMAEQISGTSGTESGTTPMDHDGSMNMPASGSSTR